MATIPNLILREVVVACVLLAFVMLWSVTLDAPLEAKANPGLSPNPTKAPWYFAGLQELLLHFHPLFAVVVIPLVAAVAILAVAYVRYDADLAGNWFLSIKGRRMAGQLGNVRVTQRNLKVVRIDTENNLLLVRGAVPGPNGGYLIVRETNKLG